MKHAAHSRACSVASTLTWVIVLTLLGCSVPKRSAAAGEPEWTSPNRRYRIPLTVNPLSLSRSNCPTSTYLNFAQALANQGETGTFDEHAIEVISHDANGDPRVYDSSRPGYEKYLLPWQIDKFYGIDSVSLNFVVPDESWRQYAVYFDTVQSGVGQPERYPGLVGDGDWFKEGYKRREINACHFDSFCDFDGDGDLDLFKAGVEPFVYCYENVGGSRFVDRGRLTSAGSLLTLPKSDGSNRSWLTIEFYDWDQDGDKDLFTSYGDGPYSGEVVYFENITVAGGQLTFADRGPVRTQSGQSLGQGGWFPAMTFVVDWDHDGDGKIDVLMGTNNRCYLHRNLRRGTGTALIADNGVAITAGGAEINLSNPRFDCADIDNDGDRELFAGTQPGPIYLFENVDTTPGRTNPTFAAGEVIAFAEPYYISDAHSGVKVADFTGDGLPDFVVGRFWERTSLPDPEQPREYGWLYENVGTATSPQFAKRDALNGAPYTQRFQICDAVRQNAVRACDWNNDGRPDLIAGDTDGYVWLFVNMTGRLFPVFATGEKLRAGGQVLSVMSSGGHARPDVCDWNNDGKKDLLVADGGGWLTWFRNEGTDAAPVLASGQRISADGSPIARGGRSSVLVCDWNNDAKKDVIFADQDNGYVFFRNVGSDSNPVLATPQSLGLTFYTRPNLGSFVDWNGDGKKDFIGCNFENNIRLYVNVGSGQPGSTPQFSNPDGVTIVQPYTIMTVSGADAVDWNADGDLDILTGQGHGGGGLRFYERDYIDNCINNTHPSVIAGNPETRGPGDSDFDADGDVDQEDFAHLQACFVGVGVLRETGCEGADLDVDLDVDQEDFAMFQQCMGGPSNPPGC